MIPFNQSFFDKQTIIHRPVRVKIRKTWKERLLSCPWKPWIKHKYEYQNLVEDGQVFQVNLGYGPMYIMNERTRQDLILKTTDIS